KAFSEEEIQALLASPDLAPFKTAPLVVKADSLEENSALLVPAAPLGFAFLTDLLATPIIIGIVVILVILALAWQNGKREKPYLHLGNVHNSLKGRVSNLKEKSVQARSRRREDPFEKAMEEFSGQEETLESAMKKFKEAKPETPKTLSTTESTMGKTILAPVTQKQKEIQEKTTEKKEPIAHEGTWKTKLTGLFGSNPNKMLLQSRRPDCATVLLREAGHPSLCLKLKNGVTVKGLCDLDAVLQEMDDTTFVFHKNPSRDDFSAWVRRSVGDNVLANKLELLDSKQDIARAVHLRVDWLKHQINE
ncbi:hypothetical protein KJ972_01975, partial [Candidatus Micrarchaeota archaeon]|nr:hypothetical protein [Candidatus Micrarchaeota archaeon]